MSDYDSDPDDLRQANINFVPQIGEAGGGRKKRGRKSRGDEKTAAEMAAELNNPSCGNGLASPPLGYSSPIPGFAGQPQMQMQMQNNNSAYPGQNQQPNLYGNSNNDMNMMKPSPVMAQPVMGETMMMPSQPNMMMMGAGGASQPMLVMPPGGNNGNSPAMVILMQEQVDLDFRAPALSCGSFNICLNATFLPYCMLARIDNYMKTAPMSLFKHNENGMVVATDPQRAQQVAEKTTSWNGCCGLAMLFDAGRIALAVLFPQQISLASTGLCVQSYITRTRVRARYNIQPQCFQDCALSWCCPWCSASQLYYELTHFRHSDPRLVCGENGLPLQQGPGIQVMH